MPRGIKYMKNMCSSRPNLGFLFQLFNFVLSVHRNGGREKKTRKKGKGRIFICKLHVFDESDRPDWLFFGGTKQAAFSAVPFSLSMPAGYFVQ